MNWGRILILRQILLLHWKKKIKVPVNWGKERKRYIASALGLECLRITPCQYNGKQCNLGQKRCERWKSCECIRVLCWTCHSALSSYSDSDPVLIYGFSLVENRMWVSRPKWIWVTGFRKYMETEIKSNQLPTKLLFIKVSASLQNRWLVFHINEKKVWWHKARKMNTMLIIRSSFQRSGHVHAW